jgi:hypothetical protein
MTVLYANYRRWQLLDAETAFLYARLGAQIYGLHSWELADGTHIPWPVIRPDSNTLDNWKACAMTFYQLLPSDTLERVPE